MSANFAPGPLAGVIGAGGNSDAVPYGGPERERAGFAGTAAVAGCSWGRAGGGDAAEDDGTPDDDAPDADSAPDDDAPDGDSTPDDDSGPPGADGDGSPPGEDCDDSDPNAHPGAPSTYDVPCETAPYPTCSGPGAGAAYLVRGPVAADLDLTYGLPWFHGEAEGSGFGGAQAVPGDVSGDGIRDLVVGAAGEEAVHLFYGPFDPGQRPAGTADVTFRSAGPAPGLGTVVASVGDLDGDGLDEVAMGVPVDSGLAESGGAVYVFRGRGATPTP